MPAPVFRFLACLSTLFALSLPLLAQEATPDPKAPLQMALSSPFAFTQKPLMLLVRRGRWFPVAVTLSNTGDPVAGTVRLKLRAGGDFENAPNEFYCPVDLPTNARKVIWLYGRLERPNVAAVEISFSGRGFKTQTQRVPVREPEEGQRVILTVSDGDSGLSDTLKSLRGSGLSLTGAAQPTGFNPNNSQGPLRPVETTRAGVPDRWFGLECADLVVLGDFAHTALLPPQIEALRGFVMGGGNLLALGGSNAARLATSPLADLWPAQVGNSGSAGAGEVAGIVERYVPVPKNGADRLGGSPVVVARGPLKTDAQLSAGTRAVPLFSSLDRGAGRVLLLGFDPSQPPFNGWSGQNSLWKDVFGAGVKLKRLDSVDSATFYDGPNYYGGRYMGGGPISRSYEPQEASSTPTGQLLDALARASQQRKMPPVSQIAWFLALYVFVLVPLNYTILRFTDRRELAWITIPIIVVAFSGFAYAAALSIRGNAILTRQVDVVQGSLGSPAARADSLLWLFSPKRTTYDISSQVPTSAVADYANDAGGKQGAFSILQPADASGFKVEGANVWMWTDRAFSAQSLVPLGKGLSWNGDRIQNGSSLELRGAVWVQDREVRALGTVASGATVAIPAAASERAVEVDLPAAIIRASGLDKVFDEKTVANGIAQNVLNMALGGGQNAGTLLVAWATEPAAPLSIGTGGARENHLTLMIFRAAPP
ncbi:MAG: hypothetical protein KY445_16435, partial [Armatimonadetes bacterium]|nr:hypothetical protein [Armatimonadota bacterium]